MYIRENLEELIENLDDYLQSMGLDTSKRTMDCPICGDKGGFGFVPDTDHKLWHCFSAKHSSYPKNSGNIFYIWFKTWIFLSGWTCSQKNPPRELGG